MRSAVLVGWYDFMVLQAQRVFAQRISSWLVWEGWAHGLRKPLRVAVWHV